MFKMLIGKGHFEFSSNRQQDASEFLLHLLATVQRTDRALAESDSLSLVSLFQFQVWNGDLPPVLRTFVDTLETRSLLLLQLIFPKNSSCMQFNKKGSTDYQAQISFLSCLRSIPGGGADPVYRIGTGQIHH